MVCTSVVIPVPRKRILRQSLAIFCGFICQFLFGISFAWASPALVKLLDKDSPIPITTSQGSTVASISVVGGVISPILYALMVDVYGRKPMMIIGLLLHATNWIVIYFSTALYQLYAARIIFGFALGFSYGLVPTYIGEVTETNTRGVFGVVTSTLFSLGMMFEYIVGPYVSFHTLGLCNLIFPVVGIMCLVFMPESPYFLVRQKRYEEATRNLMWLRAEDKTENVAEEMQAIKEFVASSPKRPFKEIMKEMSIYVNRLALFLLTLLMIGQQFNGGSVIKTYFHYIIESTGIDSFTNLAVIILDLSGIMVMLCTLFMVNRVGRKTLFMLTCCGSLVGSFVTGLYFYLRDKDVIGAESAYIAIVGILCIQIFNAFGASTVPTLITSEMSTASIRSWFGAYKVVCLSIFNSASVKIFQVVNDNLGTAYGFWLYTMVIAFLIILLIIFMPETRGKSLQEIQDMLTKKHRRSERKEDI